MNVTPTAGIAAAWSATKPNPNQQAADLNQKQATMAAEEPAPDTRKGPPALDGQGTAVDKRA